MCMLARCAVAVSCPNGFVQHDDSCYKVFHIRGSWSEAKVTLLQSLSLSVPPLCPPLSPSPPLSLLLCDVQVCMTRWSVRCSTIVSTNVCVVYFRGTVRCSAQHYSFHEIIVRVVYFRVILRCLVQHYSFHEWFMLCILGLPWGVRCSASFTIIDSCCVFQGYCSVFGAAL